MPQVWQIAAGETGRDYTKLFLDYDLMFMGPGNPGAYYKHSYDALVEQKKDDKSECFCQA